MKRRRCLWCLIGALALTACPGVSGSAFTDDIKARKRAAAAARKYVTKHRAELVGAKGSVEKGHRIQGGSLRGVSDRAFEVRLSVSGAVRITEVVAYVHDDDGLVVAGAQARDKYGAVVRDLGGHLDRKFHSRD